MTLDTLILFAGAFVAALPFLGFPNSWDKVLLLLVGVFIVALGIVVRRRIGTHTTRSVGTYAESAPQFKGAHEEV